MNSFEGRVRKVVAEKIKNSLEHESAVDSLIDEFPEELHERLYKEVEDLDDKTAEDFVISKLIERKRALVVNEMRTMPEDVMVTHECPLAIMKSLEREVEKGDDDYLGSGENGKVVASLRQDRACYKVLYPERVRTLGLNIVREAVMQHHASKLLKQHEGVAQVPSVLAFVDHERARAIMMEKINGVSVLNILNNEAELPHGFDIDACFEKLERAVELLNEHGFYHRDLTNNAGNIMIDELGQPWIVDFGSAVKALQPENGDTMFYTLTPGGTSILAHDKSGIASLKKRLKEHLTLLKEAA
jgi:tRNA A-37 threonylcarbamoyl transferase component Bud32